MTQLFKSFRGDFFGGITAGVVALPLALAFGLQSGLGPSAGLYGAIFLSFFAAFLGGTPTQISGPTAPMTAVSMVVIGAIVLDFDGDIQAALPTILLVFVLAGLLQILMSVVKFGRIIRYMPYPVISGFMTGIGVIILITQILPTLGYEADKDLARIHTYELEAENALYERFLLEEAHGELPDLQARHRALDREDALTEESIWEEATKLAMNRSRGVMGSLRSVPHAIRSVNPIELSLTLITVLIIYAVKRFSKKIPGTLVALVLITGGAYLLDLEYRGIGDIPRGLPKLHTSLITEFSWGSISPYLTASFMLAILGALDSLLTSVVADNLTGTKHHSDRELFGQGVGNSIGALFGGIPGAGATIRTVVNIQAGGTTRLSGMISSLFLLAILLVLAPLAEAVPAAVLAGVLITVGIGVMDFKGLKAIPKSPPSDVLVMITVLVITVSVDLIVAVGVGLLLSTLFFMYRMKETTIAQSGVETAEDIDHADVVVKKLNGPVFFAAARDLVELTERIPTETHVVIIDMQDVPFLDQTGIFAVEEMVKDFIARDIEVFFAGIQHQPGYRLRSLGIVPKLVPDEKACFDSVHDAKMHLRERAKGEE